MQMSRRGFIKVGTAAGGTLLLPSVLQGGAGGTPEALRPWQGPRDDDGDVRHIVLSYAILAANPHNSQPWLVELRGELGFDLRVDPERLLPDSDPPFRQTHIGQGTFLENADLAARELGYRAEIDYFPEGMYGETELEPRPVARVELVRDPDVEKDPLFALLTARRTNKRAFDGSRVTSQEIRALERAYDTSTYTLRIAESRTQVARLAELARRGMETEVSSEARNLETLEWFRFSDAEIERHRDGFGLAAGGMSWPMRWIAETFVLSRERTVADPRRFAREAIAMAERQAASAALFGWITSPQNSRLDQVLVGRAYERVNLTAAALGLAMHPFSQPLQEYPEADALRKDFCEIADVPPGHTVQMFFRLGRARPTTHTPRRPVEALLRG
jgi:hypothetical protein